MARTSVREGSLPDDYSSAVSTESIETAKLDARIFSADDFDGQTDGAASSGNFNYAMLQGDVLGDTPQDTPSQRQEAAGHINGYESSSAAATPQPIYVQTVPTQGTTFASDSPATSTPVEPQTVAVSNPTYAPVAGSTGDAGTQTVTNNNSSESSFNSEFIQEVIENDDDGGDTTIIITENNNINNTTINITNNDNSTTGDTISSVTGPVTTIINNLGNTTITNVVENVLNIVGDVNIGDNVTSIIGDVTTIINVIGGGGGNGGPIDIDIGDVINIGGDIIGGDIINIGNIGDVIGDVITNIDVLNLGETSSTSAATY